MPENLFGTDGIRSIAGEHPLDIEGCIKIGQAIGSYFADSEMPIMIGGDTRESSPLIASSVSVGIMSAGSDVEVIGVAPTAATSYITRISDVVAGVMITASHNPYFYNGIKIFDGSGHKLLDETQDALNELWAGYTPFTGYGASSDKSESIQYYRRLILDEAGMSLDGINLCIDTANGAASELAPELLGVAMANVTAIANSPNGKNINENCGALHTENLSKTVTDNKLDMGIALDGDADRIIMVDERGRQLTGDHLMYINAITEGHRGIVATNMSNIGLERALAARDIRFHRTSVGDRAVSAAMKEQGLTLGGEQSGHLIFSDVMPTGDGLLAAIRTIRSVIISGKSLGEWRDELQLLPQSIASIPVANKNAAVTHPAVTELVNRVGEELGAEGRVDLRASGTEPVVRLMIEAENAEHMINDIARKITELLQA